MEKEAVEIELKRQEVIEKELANIEKMRELEFSTVDECAKSLADSSQHLEIQPSEATLEDTYDVSSKCGKSKFGSSASFLAF